MRTTLLNLVLFSLVATLALALESTAQEKKTRDQLVQDDLTNFGSLDTWIYNDLERGFKTAQ